MKLVVREAESAALVEGLAGEGPYVTSIVGEIETVRACVRAGLPDTQADELRAGLSLVALDDAVRRAAAVVGPPTLRTLDAVHLATALSLGEALDALVTYDDRLAAAASESGLRVLSPGAKRG